MAKKEKKKKLKNKSGLAKKKDPLDQELNTIEELCKVLKFRSKNPKIIDLTEEERMPETLQEQAVRCSVEEKDLYLYYYLQRKAG